MDICTQASSPLAGHAGADGAACRWSAAAARVTLERMERICVAYDEGKEAVWALQFAVELARRTSARLTLAHVAPVDDEPLDDNQRLLFELCGHSEAVRCRQRLNGLALTLGADLQTDVEVVVGPVAPTLLDLVRADPPDVLVAGTRRGRLRQMGPRLSHVLIATAPCPLIGPPAISGAPA